MLAPGQFADVGGRLMHFVTRGQGEPTVVFESGGGGGSSVQDWPVMQLVSKFTRCLCYDRAGLGWSERDPSQRTFDTMALDLHALLRSANVLNPCVVVGSSFGGLVARVYTSHFPHAVAGMVLVDAAEEHKYFSTIGPTRAFLEKELLSAARRAASGELRAEYESQAPRRDVSDQLERDALLHLLGSEDHFHAARFELAAIDQVAYHQRRAGGLGSLGRRPLIVLSHGVPYQGPMAAWEDGWLDAQRRLAALSTNSVHIIASRNGHSIGVENPALVAASIAAVVDAVRGAPLDASKAQQFAAGL